ncbi:hypothetical protein PIROE2DRAFT_1114 [Piromyces sp. E2]|nr:hypothetical protein PIROE2DRAFT_1114 [Piromyces sp. E2]|eukprot:OUM70593.1 hypothetical protein PIROE2DRAFT_1114 [Piromyces sp. E2]
MKITPKNVQIYFDKISDILLNETLLLVKSKCFRIAEIEFYYNDIERHHDPFTHNDPIQYNQNYWYFHRKGGVYRGGTWKGVDITFGQLSPIKYSGGILVRSIQEINNNKSGEYIHGPSKVVDKILEIFKRNSVKELVEEEFDNNIDIKKNQKFTLCSTSQNSIYDNVNQDTLNIPHKRELSNNNEEFDNPKKKKKTSKSKFKNIPDNSFQINLKKEKIYKMPRVGLAPHTENGKDSLQKEFYYLMRNYRYIIYPNLVRKGKVQLIIGLYLNNMNSSDIQSVTESKSALIEKYIMDFEQGKKMKLKQLNIKKVDDLCRLFGFIFNQLNS